MKMLGRFLMVVIGEISNIIYIMKTGRNKHALSCGYLRKRGLIYALLLGLEY